MRSFSPLFFSRTPFLSKWGALKTTSKHDTFVHINLLGEYPIVCFEIRKADVVLVLFVQAFDVWMNRIYSATFVWAKQVTLEMNAKKLAYFKLSLTLSALSHGDTLWRNEGAIYQCTRASCSHEENKKFTFIVNKSLHRLSFVDEITKRISPCNAKNSLHCCSWSNGTQLITSTVVSSFSMILFKNDVFCLAKSVCHCRAELFSHSILAFWEIFYSCRATAAQIRTYSKHLIKTKFFHFLLCFGGVPQIFIAYTVMKLSAHDKMFALRNASIDTESDIPLRSMRQIQYLNRRGLYWK